MPVALGFSVFHCGRIGLTWTISVFLVSLALTHFNPKRFRIHPLPYLSDAGLRDPERMILSIGMYLSSAFLCVVALAQNLHQRSRLEAVCGEGVVLSGKAAQIRDMSKMTLTAAVVAAGGLTCFGGIPGYWYGHHIVTSVFAVAAAVWTMLGTYVEGQVGEMEMEMEMGTGVGVVDCEKHVRQSVERLRSKYRLGLIVLGVVVGFVGIWGTIKLKMPPMTPNTDRRFIALALLEYIGVSAFIRYLYLVVSDVASVRMEVSIISPPASATHPV